MVSFVAALKLCNIPACLANCVIWANLAKQDLKQLSDIFANNWAFAKEFQNQCEIIILN